MKHCIYTLFIYLFHIIFRSNGVSTQLIKITDGNLSPPMSSLQEGQTVSGIVLISNGICSVEEITVGEEIGETQSGKW